MDSLPDSDDTFLLVEDDQLAQGGSSHERPWKILVVDDDPDVHRATQLALRGMEIDGQPLHLQHAYSAAQALELIAAQEDFAVMLLDVVMEQEDAGLQVVQKVRQELQRDALRIILRTGQPGYAPELETIRHYDINDYKTKSELTRVRLFTCLMTAVRTYRQIRMQMKIRHGFQMVVQASTELSKLHGMQLFAQGVVGQLCGLLEVEPEGLICARAGQDEEQEPTRVIAAAGRFSPYIHQPLQALPLTDVQVAMAHCLQSRTSSFTPHLLLYFDTADHRGLAAYLDIQRPLNEVDMQLLQVFCTSISVGFDNVLLYGRLVNQAYVDPLLNIPNLNRLLELLDSPQLDRHNSTLALLDIDDFSAINDAMGHEFGNEVLRTLSQHLISYLPHSQVARISGDVMAVLGSTDEVNPSVLQRLLLDTLTVRDQPLHVQATLGLVDLRNRSSRGQQLLKDAQVALKEAKLRQRGEALYFCESMGHDARERMRLVSGLREAFETQHFFLMYQPKVNMLNGQATGMEALLRWRRPDGELVPPDRFIPLAEQSGMMVALGTYVMRSACQQLGRLRTAGHTHLVMAINVSQTQLRDPHFVSTLRRALTDAAVPPEQVELEITESMASENLERMRVLLAEIRTLGVGIAIDDFGTGFSSLSVLRHLPAQRLKIDRSFIHEMHQNDSIARMVISLGHSLGMHITAEGVETEEQWQALRDLGCQEGQGWLFARPMEESALLNWLNSKA